MTFGDWGRYRRSASTLAVLTALVAANGAQAQTASDAAHAADEKAVEGEAIVVTGMRIAARPGFTSPTPVTSITAREMLQRAPVTIADTLASMPAFRVSSSPQTSGVTTRGGGIVTADLRALGPTRTLVLVDDHRYVPSGSDGVVDLKLIPQLLISSVDVVTGGASAAYGSDAVAGVVNFKLDTKMRGVKGSVQGGISDYGDAKSVRASLAAGGAFMDQKVTWIAGIDYSKFNGVGNQYSRPWGRREIGLITNPLFAANGLPSFIISPNVRPATMAPGGLVVSGPLRGTVFLPNGQVGQFNFGTIYGPTNASMIGGDNAGNNLSNATRLASPVESIAGLAHLEIDAGPAFNPYAEFSYGWTRTDTQSQQPRLNGPTAITVGINNPFLPPSVRTAMTNAGVSTISVGRLFNDTGPVQVKNVSETFRVLGGIKGDLGSTWKYDLYGQYGRNKQNLLAGPNNLILGRFFQEVAGCPSPLASQGCVPQNIFGAGSVKVDNYAFDTAVYDVKTEQVVVSGNVTGNPFSTWAGEVSFAGGVEYRQEKANATSDPVSQLLIPVGTSGQSIAGGFLIGNQLPLKGVYDLWEVYGETVVPLLRDVPLVKSLDFNGAIRRTDYNLSGAVTTRKAGLTWEVSDEFKLRGTRSRDIRAPNINDLYQFGGSQFAVVFDPVLNATTQTRFITIGNAGLKPERANTWTGDFVYQPRWLPGLGLSVDYYNIRVKGVIGTLSPQVISARCIAGGAASCANIVRNANGSYAFFKADVQNLSSLNTEGLDFELRYQTRMPMLGASGRLSMRALATYVTQLDTVSPSGTLRRVGTLSNFVGNGDTVGGVPSFTGVFDLTYTSDKVMLNLNTRLVGSGKFNNAFREGAGAAGTISRNKVPAYAYLSLAGSYKLSVAGSDVELFGAVNNLLNTAPPMLPSGTVGFANETSTNPVFYDVLGRMSSLGLRFKF